MRLEDFKHLIQNLPVRQQSFTTKRNNKKWLEAQTKFKWLKDFIDNHFINGYLQISRQDIFEIRNSPKEKILKTIFWGYPNGMQGGHKNFAGILKQIDSLVEILTDLQNSNGLKLADLKKAQNNFKAISGLGLSTYSKLLYFFDIKIDNMPCLILDKKLLNVFQSNTFTDFNSLSQVKGNNETKYFHYLILINSSAERLKTKGENIEQFLFLFGNNLKPCIKPNA
jgi:hypothetical protein